MKKNLIKKSKFISLVLRHKPDTIGVSLDEHGWLKVTALIKGAIQHGIELDEKELDEIVFTNEKQRFSYSNDGKYIRANQGHSIGVDLELTPKEPPEMLYHGTAIDNVEAIKQQGLKKLARQHVHLSCNKDTAYRVGSRHGKPTVLRLNSKAMYQDGIEFFQSKNGVWLVNAVPPTYLENLW